MRDILFPDINFIPPDRMNGSREIQSVAKRIRDGLDITAATQPSNIGAGQVMAESNMLADRDEDFNTRYEALEDGRYGYRGSNLSLATQLKLILVP